MKILEAKSLAIPDVKVVRYGRFTDHRGYFTEHYRKSDFRSHPELGFLHDVEFEQCNESASRADTIRGLHFQWNPHMGKLVRPLSGRLIDMMLDIRLGSPTFGKIIAYDMPADPDRPYGDWVWVPPGFAHGTLLPEPSIIEYFCSGSYNPACEAGISPLAPDLDWSLCEPSLRALFQKTLARGPLLTDKDRNGFSLASWQADPRSREFIYSP